MHCDNCHKSRARGAKDLCKSRPIWANLDQSRHSSASTKDPETVRHLSSSPSPRSACETTATPQSNLSECFPRYPYLQDKHSRAGQEDCKR
ncbi:hypothetical protein ACLKA7_011026 [Drosophila subpalustris]